MMTVVIIIIIVIIIRVFYFYFTKAPTFQILYINQIGLRFLSYFEPVFFYVFVKLDEV
jgi:hypothetical protein